MMLFRFAPGEGLQTPLVVGSNRLVVAYTSIEGNQNINNENLIYGKSVTDACIGWEDTKKALYTLSEAIDKRNKNAQN